MTLEPKIIKIQLKNSDMTMEVFKVHLHFSFMCNDFWSHSNEKHLSRASVVLPAIEWNFEILAYLWWWRTTLIQSHNTRKAHVKANTHRRVAMDQSTLLGMSTQAEKHISRKCRFTCQGTHEATMHMHNNLGMSGHTECCFTTCLFEFPVYAINYVGLFAHIQMWLRLIGSKSNLHTA